MTEPSGEPGASARRLILIINDEPLAYFITWTLYGTHLQGAATGWRKQGEGSRPPQPRLEAWRWERLKYPVELLTQADREVVAMAIEEHCTHREWRLWQANVRTNHVHVVVSATGYDGAKVRDQLKANATRCLRVAREVFQDRPVWTERGDWVCINTEDDLEDMVVYVRDAQDRPR